MFKYLLAFALIQISAYSCAPMKAKSLRESRNLTVGLPGVSYRPNGNFDVGVTYAGASFRNDVTVERDDSDAVGDKALDQRKAKQKTAGAATLFSRLYPWDTSAFYVGLGYTHNQKGTTKFDVLDQNATALAEDPTELEYEVTYNTVHIPIGWAWIWENGFSLGLDLGLAATSKASSSIKSDDDKDYDDNDAKWVTDAIDEKNTGGLKLFSGATGIIGYSF